MRVAFIVLSAFFLLSACAGGQGRAPGPQAIAPGIALTLPERPPFGAGIEAQQLVRAVYGGRRDRFQAAIESSRARFALAMTVPSGPRIMTIEWHDGAIVETRGIAPAGLLPARRLLADFMFVYAPEADLRAALSGGDLVVSGRTRRLFRNGVLLVEAVRPDGNPWEGPARLSNFAHDYELLIDSHGIGPQ
ncbi:MAG: DUF3261 domain-containing protein [Parvibaculum sp.]